MTRPGVERATHQLQQSMLRRALAARDPGRLHLHFAASVIERYREVTGAQLVRTRTVGRVAIPGQWSLDLGIAADGSLHAPFQDVVDRLPEREWEHWIEHLVALPASSNFLQMRAAAGACIDDGDTEPWT